MPWLILVSFVWAFSFGLIKGRLAGIDPALVSLLRVALALLVFAPLFRPRGLRPRDTVVLIAIGAVQFGVMYVSYIAAFAYLEAYQVVLWTIFTPLLVCICSDLFERRLHLLPYLAAGIAIVGAAIVKPIAGDAWRGIALVQVSNAAFALGQIAYRRWRRGRSDVHDSRVFALPYFGAVLVTLPLAAPALDTLARLAGEQWLTLVYLGVIASGAGFFLWNYGAARTAPGPLAVANNLKIPLGVACSLWIFGEQANPTRIVAGGALVVAAGLLAEWAERRPGRNPSP